MITNNVITYYKKGLNENKLTKWTRYVFKNVWVFGGKGSSINKGYENANDVNVRIPMEYIEDTSIFAIGDIVAIGTPTFELYPDKNLFVNDNLFLGTQNDIIRQCQLNGIEFYNVTSININNFGNNQHVHLGGK